MDIKNRIAEFEEQVCESAQAIPRWANDTIQEQPVSSVCAVFATGFAVGVGIVALMATTPRHRKLMDPESLAQRISEAVSQVIPKQLSDAWSR
ncbi:hypothetical protein [Planctomicrobium sp. SH527]|uniref:hypothetical protein n=1 Tax=Planctomicrobium sp. SH527 TaxID=3448123 RepID=UPI003F5BA772